MENEPIPPKYAERDHSIIAKLRPRDIVVTLHMRHRDLFKMYNHSRIFLTVQCFRVGFYILKHGTNGVFMLHNKTTGQDEVLDFWNVEV